MTIHFHAHSSKKVDSITTPPTHTHTYRDTHTPKFKHTHALNYQDFSRSLIEHQTPFVKIYYLIQADPSRKIPQITQFDQKSSQNNCDTLSNYIYP